jgi:drug/metabolite transporter (DMT)-like permease
MKNLLLLHLVVLIFGFTGILGKLITVSSEDIVWYRMFIGVVSTAIYFMIKGFSFKMNKGGVWKTLLTGIIIAAHWIFFFESIKQSNVSIGLIAIATSSTFTAFLEPLFFKRRFRIYELFLSVIVICGVILILQFGDNSNHTGLLLGIVAAFLASLFTVINGRLIQQYDHNKISLYELSGGFLAVTVYFILSKNEQLPNFQLSTHDLLWLILLGVICTAFAFMATIKVMKELTPFTVSLSINMEPVYGILLALLIFGESEKMSSAFYIGSLVILAALFLNAFLKRRARKKALRLEKKEVLPTST